MPRDVNGNYTLPAGNPVVPHTIIETDWANPTCDDIAAALTDSLSRTGSGGMLVPFRNADGTMANPGMTWVNEPTSGWYRAGVQDFWYAVGSQNVFRISSAGIELAPGKTAIGISSFIRVQDAEPVGMRQGEEWWESDTGGFYMRYQNPDLTFTWVALAAAGGDFIPMGMRGVANGVASLDAGGQVPLSQLGNVPPVSPTVLMPTGAVIDFAGTVAPAGYVACDGAAINRVTFAALFAAIGIVWGPGDGSTTFNVPNLNRRTTVGSGGAGTGTLGNAVGNVGGEEGHVQTLAEMAAHGHTVNDPGHTHTLNPNVLYNLGGPATLSTAGSAGTNPPPTNSAVTGITISNAGTSAAANVIQPSAVMLKVIKT